MVARVGAEALARVMHRALEPRGVSPEHAGFVVEGLIEASLRGIDTHGVRLFRTYLAELDGGRAKAQPQLSWREAGAAARVLDAGAALGVVAGRVAANETVRLAREFGVGAVVVRNSNHFGPASCYTLAMARQQVLGFSCTNSDALVAPFRGTQPLMGTNPISLVAPGLGDELFCADFATSQVSYSKVKHYREQGQPLPAGWAVAKDGQDAAGRGAEIAALHPLGGYKGQCLGMMVEILCPLLAGEPLDHELSHLYVEPFDQPRRVAHFFFGLHLPAFTDPDSFRAQVSRLLALARAQDSAGNEPVQAPGDPEATAEADRRQHGIPLTPGELEFFRELDASTGGDRTPAFEVSGEAS